MRIAYMCLQATREGQASHAHVHEIIRGLERRDIEVVLYEPDYADGDALPRALGRLREFHRVQRRLLDEADRYDALYVRHHWATYPASMAFNRRGIPVVQEVNGPHEDFYVAWPAARRYSLLFDRGSRRQLAKADAVVAVTPGLAKWTRRESGRERGVFVIPNGADPDRFRPGAKGSIAIDKPYVVFIGALSGWQGIDTLLEAVFDPAWPIGVGLAIVGDGEAADRVRAAATGESVVRYLGSIRYDQVPGVLAGSLASLIPKNGIAGHSVTGLYPIKLFETMSSGIPAVVTDFPGMADLIRELEAGVVIPPQDPQALAAAVRSLADDPDLAQRLGGNGRRGIVETHSWDRRAEATAEVLKSLV